MHGLETLLKILIPAICRIFAIFRNEQETGGSVTEWSGCGTRNPVVPGLTPTLATCWFCSRLS